MSIAQLDLLASRAPGPATPPQRLRPYQQQAVEACLASLAQGHHPVLALPTGSGKSRVIAALCDTLPGRILVATHRQELLEQNAAQLVAYTDEDLSVGLYSAGLARRESAARVVFGGIQSIYSKMTQLQAAGAFAAVIVDECHLCPPPSLDSMYGTVFRACPGAHRVGLTATPYRLDSALLHTGGDTWFDAMPVHLGIRDLTPAYLAPLAGVLTAHDIDVSRVRTRAGEFVSSDLSQAACEEVAIRGAVEELCSLAQQRRTWLLFCVDVTHTRLVTLALQERGVAAGLLLGETDRDSRREVLERFRAGALRALVNCQVATTGFDIPDVDCVVMLRPTQSKALCVQMLGRGTRKADGKENCLVLDFAGNIERHAPLDELFTLTKSASRAAADAARERQAAAARERAAKHRREASLADPMAATPDRTPQTYRVTQVHYRVQQAKRFPGRQMLLASYFCPERRPQRYVPQWICLEHDGWAREQAVGWFHRRGAPAPTTARDAMRTVYSLPQPRHIVVREDGAYPRVVMEQFEAEESPHA